MAILSRHTSLEKTRHRFFLLQVHYLSLERGGCEKGFVGQKERFAKSVLP
jgi:hypothetical protein